jgi:UDP-N-acetylglucosamine 4-epimerase
LFKLLQNGLRQLGEDVPNQTPIYQEFRAGDVRHSLADISKAQQLLHYTPQYSISQGIPLTLKWYRKRAEAGGG